MHPANVRARCGALLGVCALLLALVQPGAGAGEKELVFRHTVSGAVLDVHLAEGEPPTTAVRQFHQTGTDPYVGDAGAVAQGEQLFNANCLFCHGPRAEGKIGPNLADDQVLYPSNRTDKGLFETVYGGATNLMAGWKGRLSQDDILKVIAYLRSLQAK